MEDIKNQNDEVKEVVESEDVVEVALAESAEDAAVSEGMEYTEAELSGLTDKQKKRREIFDKITTGLLIALLCTPVAIIIYIFLWFILRG
ncbi:MAG: hypothetical protein IJD79_06225 [Clostridia bacterium]|nr:hypothetical protein [Clostridia bacterium]